MEKILIEHTIKTSYLVSVNNLYEPIIRYVKSAYGKPIPAFYGMRLSAEANKLKSTIYSELEKANCKFLEPVDWDKPLSLTTIYVLSSSIARRDLGNLEKCITDAIFKYFDLNDNRIYESHQYKIYNKKGIQNEEYVKFRITQPDIVISNLSI